MKKIIRVLGVIIVLILALLIVLPIIFKGELIQIVKDEANNNLNAKVDFGEFDLSVFSSFPDFSFKINNVKVEGIGRFEGVTLANIETFETTLDVMSVVKGEQIGIKSFQLIRPEIHAIVLKDSTANWDIAKPSEQESAVEEEVVDTSETKFAVSIREYAIKDAHIIYDDRLSDMYAELTGFTHEGAGDFTQDIFDLITNTEIAELTFDMEGVSYAKKMNIDFDVALEIDNPKAKYIFKENTFKFNQLSLGLDGWVQMPENDDMNMEVTFQVNQTTFKSLLSLVPGVYKSDFNDIETNGKLALYGSASGKMTDVTLPAFNVDLKVDDAMFHYPDLPKSVENIQIDINVSNPGGSEDKTIVNINKFHVEMGDNPVDVSMLLKTPISDPDISGMFKAQIDLASIKDFIPVEEGENYNGNITSNIEFAGKMSTIDQEDYENFLMKGNLIVLDVNYQTSSMPYNIDVSKLYMDFSPKFVELTAFEANIGRSDMAASGRIDNFLAYALRDESLSGTFNIVSNYMDLNEFMEDDTTSTSVDSSNTTADTTASGVIEVPSNINFVMKTDIKEMLYDNIEMKEVKGKVTIQEGQVVLDHLGMELMDGSMEVTGVYDTRKDLPTVDFTYDIDHFDLRKSFETFNTVEKLVPIAEKSSGSFSTSLEFKAVLDENMEPILNTMDGSGDLLTHSVEVQGTKALVKMAEMFQMDELKKMNLNNVTIRYQFKDGRINIKPFDMKIADKKATVSGSHGFDETMDYVVNTDLSTAKMGGQANEVVNSLLSKGSSYGVNAQLPETINLDIYVKGTFEDPKISTSPKGTSGGSVKEDLQQVVEEKVEEIKEQVEEVIEDTKEKARAEADKILAKAQIQADEIKKTAQKSAEATRKQGYDKADKLEAEARNPLEKKAAKLAADKIRKEADKKAQQIVAEGDKKAQAVMDAARKKADELLK